jgi:hypothetical protein
MFRARFFPAQCVTIFYPPELPADAASLFNEHVVFVWDRLMDPEFAREVLGRYAPFAAAYAPQLARITERGGAEREYRLVEDREAVTPGAVLIGLTDDELARLDDHYRAPMHMTRHKLKVRIGDLERVVDVYLSQGSYLA